MNDFLPMPCEEWEEKLAAIHPDDLLLAERKALEIHIASCSACEAVLSDYHKMDELIRSSLVLNQPLQLWEDVNVAELYLQSVSSNNSFQSKQQIELPTPVSLNGIVGKSPTRQVVPASSTTVPRLFQKSHTPTTFSFKYSLVACLSLVLVLLFVELCLVGLSTLGLMTNLGCGALALDSSCQPPSPTVTVPTTAVPTAAPTFVLTPTPTPTLSGVPSQAPTPTPFPELTDQQVVTNTINHYVVLVVVDGAYSKAYNLLSADLQANESYDEFIQNPNYTLKKGCWITGTMHILQRNSLTWDAGVELTQMSCVDTTPIAYYDWYFQVQQENGLFKITSVGLYPMGAGN